MASRSSQLPEWLESLFWDQDFSKLSWLKDSDLITARILIDGTWKAARWLRKRLGDEELRNWIERRRGRGLSPQRLRFWEIVLDLPHSQVTSWLAARQPDLWGKRVSR